MSIVVIRGRGRYFSSTHIKGEAGMCDAKVLTALARIVCCRPKYFVCGPTGTTLVIYCTSARHCKEGWSTELSIKHIELQAQTGLQSCLAHLVGPSV